MVSRIEQACTHYRTVEQAKRAMLTRQGKAWIPEQAEALATEIAKQHHVSVASMRDYFQSQQCD